MSVGVSRMSGFPDRLIVEPWGIRVRLAEPLREDERASFLDAFAELAAGAAERPPGVALVDLRDFPLSRMHAETAITAMRLLMPARIPRCAVVVDDWNDARVFAGLAAEAEHQTQMRVFLCENRGEPVLAIAWVVYEIPVPERKSPLFDALTDEEP